MRRIRLMSSLTLAAVLAASAGSVGAQTLSLNWNPRSGDVWVDTQLADMNRYGSSYRDPFIDEMVRYHGAPRDLVTDLLVNRRWAPGDVYYACAIAQVINRPCRYVADEWQANRGQGWGVVAKRLGIKPGSPEFHRLKRGFVPTYDRWSRPIRLDDDLRRAYPDRGRGHDHKPAKAHGKAGDHDRGHDRGNGKHNGKGNHGKGNGRSHH
ncbi:MAG TPA: hypothetical protein VGE09_17905 [Pseudoxanthomonas sp.]